MPISTILLSHQTAVCMYVVDFCVSFDFSAKPSIWGRYAVVCCFMSIDFSANLSDCSGYAVSCFVSIEFSINPAWVHRYSAGILWVIGLFLQNRQSEVCMLLSAVLSAGIDRYLWVAAGSL